jgi:hypothetical protein
MKVDSPTALFPHPLRGNLTVATTRPAARHASIRSKNAGPFEITLDIVFKTKEISRR